MIQDFGGYRLPLVTRILPQGGYRLGLGPDIITLSKIRKKIKYLKVESLNGRIWREANFFFKARIS